jgi:secondary thiamine-phosphate synthase enzyme
MADLVVNSSTNKQILDITGHIQDELENRHHSGSGALAVNLLHTTAGLTMADLDPGTDQDFLDFVRAITPDIQWRHPHDPAHTPSHLLSSLIGTTLTIPFADGRLQLGTWQRIILVELDGPRERSIAVGAPGS